MYILIKNQEGESMNLLSQNTDFNALLAAMKTDVEAEYEKATGYAIDLDEDSGSDYEVGINVEDSAADGFCLASGYMYSKVSEKQCCSETLHWLGYEQVLSAENAAD